MASPVTYALTLVEEVWLVREMERVGFVVVETKSASAMAM